MASNLFPSTLKEEEPERFFESISFKLPIRKVEEDDLANEIGTV